MKTGIDGSGQPLISTASFQPSALVSGPLGIPDQNQEPDGQKTSYGQTRRCFCPKQHKSFFFPFVALQLEDLIVDYHHSL